MRNAPRYKFGLSFRGIVLIGGAIFSGLVWVALIGSFAQ